MPVITQLAGNKQHRPVKIWTDEIEPQTLEQLHRVASLPFIYQHVAGMPDVHPGIGATVGSVIATVSAVIPSAVGVDIGCGMNAVQLSLKAADLPDNLYRIRHEIERSIPLLKTYDNRDYLGLSTLSTPPLTGVSLTQLFCRDLSRAVTCPDYFAFNLVFVRGRIKVVVAIE